MVYNNIGTTLCGYLPAGKNVTIKLINILDDNIICDDVCKESVAFPGLYTYNTSNIVIDEGMIEIAYVMTDDNGQMYGGKIVINNTINEQIKMIKQKLSELPDNFMDYTIDETNEIDYKKLLMIIKNNTDLILV